MLPGPCSMASHGVMGSFGHIPWLWHWHRVPHGLQGGVCCAVHLPAVSTLTSCNPRQCPSCFPLPFSPITQLYLCPCRPGAGALPGGLQPLPHSGHRLPDAAAAHGRARRALRRAPETRDRPQRRLPEAAVPAQRAPAQGGQAPALGHGAAVFAFGVLSPSEDALETQIAPTRLKRNRIPACGVKVSLSSGTVSQDGTKLCHCWELLP